MSGAPDRGRGSVRRTVGLSSIYRVVIHLQAICTGRLRPGFTHAGLSSGDRLRRMSGWLAALALFVTGLVAGILNVIAGGGSFLTLPVLIFTGLPATIANATNRVGILVQNVGAVWGFHRHRKLDWRWTATTALPAAVGALGGTWLALALSDEAFRKILAFLMVVVTLWTLLSKSRAPGERDEAPPPPSGWRSAALVAACFGVGVYGGFVQAGVGFFILAVLGMAGLDLVRGNALKVLIVLLFTTLSLGLFAWQGKVEWVPGLVLGAGTLLGGQIGVHLTVLKGHRWVRMVVTAAVIVFAVLLWLRG